MSLIAGTSSAKAYTLNDVFVSVGSGLVNVFHPDGTLVQTLSTGNSGDTYTTGSAFDASGNLYVTTFGSNVVAKFDPSGNLITRTFATGFNSDPESIAFDKAGNFYVGQADGSRTIQKHNAAGAFLNSFSPTTGPRGTDWIDLASDQKTMYYTSEGQTIRRFDLATNTQLSDFNVTPLPNADAYALRILSDGGVIVANTNQVVRLDPTGAVIKQYTTLDTFAGQAIGTLFALNINPDGKSFWTADLGTNEVYHVDIATGNLINQFNGGRGIAAGLSVYGETTQGGGTAAPGPLSIAGVSVALGFSRKLRKRINTRNSPASA